MAVFTRPDSPFYWLWLEGSPAGRAKINTKVPIGTDETTAEQKKTNRALAEQIYHALMGDLARERFSLPTIKEPRPFLEHRTWYAAHITAKKRGADREYSMLRKLGAFFDDYPIDAIDRELREEWRTWRAEDVGASTINREDEVLKHMLSLAVPKYLEVNPVARLPRLRGADVETRILSRDDERQLLEVATDPYELAAVLCGLDALMRRGSVGTLKRAQDHQRYLTLLNAKAGLYKVPVSVRLRRALDALPAGDREARYFAVFGRHADIELSNRFTRLCQRAGVVSGRAQNGVTFHSLRHTGASRMLEAGVDVKTVMRIGGWTKLETLQRYLHPTDAAAQAAVNVIGTPVVRPFTKKRAKSGQNTGN